MGHGHWAMGQPCSRAVSQIGGLPLRLYATVHAGPIDDPIGSCAYGLPPSSAARLDCRQSYQSNFTSVISEIDGKVLGFTSPESGGFVGRYSSTKWAHVFRPYLHVKAGLWSRDLCMTATRVLSASQNIRHVETG